MSNAYVQFEKAEMPPFFRTEGFRAFPGVEPWVVNQIDFTTSAERAACVLTGTGAISAFDPTIPSGVLVTTMTTGQQCNVNYGVSGVRLLRGVNVQATWAIRSGLSAAQEWRVGFGTSAAQMNATNGVFLRGLGNGSGVELRIVNGGSSVPIPGPLNMVLTGLTDAHISIEINMSRTIDGVGRVRVWAGDALIIEAQGVTLPTAAIVAGHDLPTTGGAETFTVDTFCLARNRYTNAVAAGDSSGGVGTGGDGGSGMSGGGSGGPGAGSLPVS